MPNVRYQPLGPLLAGKGSRAYLALRLDEDDPARSQPAVLIWLPEETANDRELIAAVEKETARAAQLEHPNIIHVFGSTTHENQWARAVEYADGESLRRILEVGKRLPAPIAARIVVDAATGAHYGHVAGNDDGTPLVHADLRPETVLVSFAGQTKVSGYGALAVAPKEPGGRRVRGRRQHCAPEQVIGGRNAANVQTDVYLLGLLLHECLTGLVPFEDEVEFDQAVVSKPVATISEELCPTPLMAVLTKAMAKKAVDRYPSALELRDAIEQAIGALPETTAVAEHLKPLFPDDQQARAARRAMLDEGVAKFVAPLVRAQQEAKARASEPPPSAPLAPIADISAAPTELLTAVTSASPPEAPPPPSLPQPDPSGSKAPPPGPQPTTPSPPVFASSVPSSSRKTNFLVPSLIGTIVVLVAIISILMTRHGTETREIERAFPTVAEHDAGTLAVTAPDAGAAIAAAVVASDAGMAAQAPDAGARLAAVEPPDAGKPIEPAPPEHAELERAPAAGTKKGLLQLFVDPNVDVAIDGKPMGRTPFTVPIGPGKHLVRLTSKTKDINTTRTVFVPPEGGQQTQRIYLRRGYISINAPEGSPIFIDGKRTGSAPATEVGLYEGPHKLLVVVRGSKWQQSIVTRPDERTTYNVNFR